MPLAPLDTEWASHCPPMIVKEGFFMTCQEAIQYIHAFPWHSTKPGLERITALLDAIGNPQRAVRCIHVAGTNGKGSVCAMLDSVLRAAGYRTGLFTSPYIRNFRERIRVDGDMIGESELAEITEFIMPYAEALDEKPNVFELITAIGFECFRRRGVDIVVLEVGLGGRLDPTNVIENPLLSIITGIDFDHTEQLGNTLQAIAAEKAGIIKEGRPCLFGGRESSACRTIRSIASLRDAPFHTVDRSDYHVRETSLDGTVFDFEHYTNLRLPLLGSYQPSNAAIVLTALRILEQEEGITGTEEALRAGLLAVRWPARFELLSRDPVIICDGGHNPQGIAAAVKSLQTYFPEQKARILTAVMADKNYDEMIELLRPVVEHAYTVDLGNARALPAETYAKYLRSHHIEATPYASVRDALAHAIDDCRRDGTPLLCLGSLYLYNAVLDALGK